MNVKISLALLLAASVISFQEEDGGDNETARKHYGLSFHSKCRDYVKSFTCMTTCQSIGFQIFRMDFRCKCSCHGLKTTTILPFFKWRTNGTTKALPKTQSPRLYHVAGTLSPFPTKSVPTPQSNSTNMTCYYPEPKTSTADANTTFAGNESSNATDNGNSTDDISGITAVPSDTDNNTILNSTGLSTGSETNESTVAGAENSTVGNATTFLPGSS